MNNNGNSSSDQQQQPETDDACDLKAADKKLSRPMWALTKQSADEKRDVLEDAEADDLIAFANNLDLDQFMDDVELKARVAQLDQQLAQVQSIVDYEEAEEKKTEREQQRLDDPKAVPLNANDLARLDRSHGGTGAKGDGDDDAMSMASVRLPIAQVSARWWFFS